MYLLEHDAKTLLAARGVPVPPGVLVHGTADRSTLPPGPWVVKAQVPVGGRGKAGGIRIAAALEEVRASIDGILQLKIGGRAVTACRIEQALRDASEAYLGIMLDAQNAGVRVLLAPRGGMDIEAMAAEPGLLRSASCDPNEAAIAAAVAALAQNLSPPIGTALAAAGRSLSGAFMGYECTLLEINPLFVLPDGSWIAGDAKMITDDSALPRQRAVSELLEHRASAYPEAHLKLHYGCDYVVVDADGEIGLLTTGAGLSMMLIDELREAGLRPYNFLDVRTGGLRGDPSRLVHVLSWIAQGRNVKIVLVNIFAGITDLGEFARLLLAALRSVPQLKVPVVARLAGNGIEAAGAQLAAAGIPATTELAAAVASVRAHLDGARK
ncbi:MAG: ATP-grasp domain-containing protein [Betaproteobacteria bacterium]